MVLIVKEANAEIGETRADARKRGETAQIGRGDGHRPAEAVGEIHAGSRETAASAGIDNVDLELGFVADDSKVGPDEGWGGVRGETLGFDRGERRR